MDDFGSVQIDERGLWGEVNEDFRVKRSVSTEAVLQAQKALL